MYIHVFSEGDGEFKNYNIKEVPFQLFVSVLISNKKIK